MKKTPKTVVMIRMKVRTKTVDSMLLKDTNMDQICKDASAAAARAPKRLDKHDKQCAPRRRACLGFARRARCARPNCKRARMAGAGQTLDSKISLNV